MNHRDASKELQSMIHVEFSGCGCSREPKSEVGRDVSSDFLCRAVALSDPSQES
jgi:hypothetical protein